jgi:membrane-bound serine protease (ClpP class)
MVGEVGTVMKPIHEPGEGMVRVHGELWRAVSTLPIADGKRVKVVRVEGLKVHVVPEDAPEKSR